MVIDSGMGLQAFADFLQMSAEYVDMIKIGYGTSALYPQKLLKQKIDLAKSYDICVFPGGTFLELAVKHNAVSSFFDHISRVGFSGIEVSDGTISMDRRTRDALIERGKSEGLTVFSEYGKKSAGSTIDNDDLIRTLEEDIKHGASLVIVEGRESGLDVGIYDSSGRCKDEMLNALLQRMEYPSQLMWEAPLKTQQVHLLKALGSDINFGNISPHDVYSLEALRRGLRSDTMKC